MTDGANTGFSTSTSCDWLTSRRPSDVPKTTSPRVPPVATATRRSVAMSTIVSSEPLAARPVSATAPALCDTNSSPSSAVPWRPNAIESMSESNSTIISARFWSVKRTTCRRSGHVTAHSSPSSSNARLPTRRLRSRLYCVNVPVA